MAAVAAGALVVVAALIPAAPASAGPDLAKARAQAAALRVLVDRLHGEAEAAAEDYGAVNDELNDVVTRLVQANDNVDVTQNAADAEAAQTDAAAAQLYMSGGPGAIYGSVLEGRDISDVLDRIASVNSVVSGQVAASHDARLIAAHARLTAADLALLTAKRRALEDRRLAAAQRADALQQQAQTALDGADALVRQLVEQDRIAAAAAAEAAAARAGAGSVPWTTNPVPADSLAAVDRAIAEATAAPATPWAVGRDHRRTPLARYAVLRGRRRQERPLDRLVLELGARRRTPRRRPVRRHEHGRLRLLEPHGPDLQRGRAHPAPHVARAVEDRRPRRAQGPAAGRPALLGEQHLEPGRRSTTWPSTSGTG